jgi:hypothetical protein
MAETANSALYAFQEINPAALHKRLTCEYQGASSGYSSEHGLRHSFRHPRHPVAEGY